MEASNSMELDMSMIDNMLSGDEQAIQRMAMTEGPMVAKAYVGSFNNACMQITGFDDYLQDQAEALKERGSFVAPASAMSWSECH